ncbi:hypothetical protein Tco_0862823 [Tanacetum coccineum]
MKDEGKSEGRGRGSGEGGGEVGGGVGERGKRWGGSGEIGDDEEEVEKTVRMRMTEDREEMGDGLSDGEEAGMMWVGRGCEGGESGMVDEWRGSIADLEEERSGLSIERADRCDLEGCDE